MGTTNSAYEYGHNVTEFPYGPGENSPLSEWLFTTTGNKDRKKGLPVFNDTFTLPETRQELYANGELLDWDDALLCDGTSLFGGDERILTNHFNIAIYGHPDKWVYDYEQTYNNCGVNSCLNILSMAGKKDIVELTSKYQQYLNTGTVKTTTKSVYNPETGEWENKTTTTVTYPKQQPISEDNFLLWAVQNSPNDALWSESTYGKGGFIINQSNTPPTDYEDFCLHAKNCEDYKTIADLQENPTAVGGTTVQHWVNILKAQGIEASKPEVRCNFEIDAMGKIKNPPDSVYEYKEAEDGTVEKDNIAQFKQDFADLYSYIETRSQGMITAEIMDGAKSITVSTSFNNNYSQKDITITIVYSIGEGEDATEVTYTVNKTEYTKNTEMYGFAEALHKYIQEGKGVVLGGYASQGYKGGNGGGHAIVLAGSIVGEVQHGNATFSDGSENPPIEVIDDHSDDVIGFYVMDTGGWLGHTESTQFVTVAELYNFLSYNRYAEFQSPETDDPEWSSGIDFAIDVCVTEENIRKWADNLNIVGNKVKNVLSGNESQNYMYGKGGNDVLFGRGGDDYLYGDSGNDTLHGSEGNDVLVGGAGADTYVFGGYDGASNDLIITGSGKDSIQFNSFVNANLCIEKLENMHYYNNKGNLVIEYDIVDNVENPTTVVDTGSVTVKDYFAKNLYNSIKDIKVVDTTRSKSIQDSYLMPSNTTENTGLYIDKETGDYPEREIKDFLTGFVQRGHIDYKVEDNKNNTVKGTKYMDSIVGGNKNDVITAGNNNDIINGGASNDTIKAGSGDDVIWGSYGNDKIYGDAGNDTIIYRATAKENENGFAGSGYGGHDTIYSGGGEDMIELEDYSSTQLKYVKAQNDLVIFYGDDLDSPKGSITIASYFSKKGNTSIKGIVLSDRILDLVKEYNSYTNILEQATSYTGTDGYDKITGTVGDDLITGGLGCDTLYGGNGNDTLNGGQGSDKLYGQAGDNTYIFDDVVLGDDTIYTTGAGKSTLDFTDSDITFTSKGANDAINEYSFTKVKNDLVINYATETDYSDSDNATVRIASFFSSKGDFEILNADGSTLNIKNQATIYMNGDEEKKNKITGSNYNDLIVGYEYNDTFKGGKGNDTIIGGKGDDNLTGGAGTNVIQYTQGDGVDTITLTKGENLTIELSDFAPADKFYYEIVKKDLVISYRNNEGINEKLFIIKNFGTKDVTGEGTNVTLYNKDSDLQIMDLRNGDLLAPYTNFTRKKYSYTGNWHAENIDASAMNYEPDERAGYKGAKINAQAGNDTIIGSYWNDTINGGNGDDVIYSFYGVNKVDGGNGADTYHIFMKGETGTENLAMLEETTVKDSGKDAAIDVARLHCTVEDLHQLWFNIKADGTYDTTFNVSASSEYTGVNKATITGVEELYVDDKKYNIDQVVSDVANWLTSDGRNFADVQTALKNAQIEDKNALYEIFIQDSQFVTV